MYVNKLQLLSPHQKILSIISFHEQENKNRFITFNDNISTFILQYRFFQFFQFPLTSFAILPPALIIIPF